MFPHEHNHLTRRNPSGNCPRLSTLSATIDAITMLRETGVRALLFLPNLAKEVVLARKKASGLRGWD
jgi:hypothetical protein